MRLAAIIILSIALVSSAHAQTIYPLDRAEILGGSRFDLKVEVAGDVTEDQLAVTINGEDAAKVLGKDKAEFAANEEGSNHNAYWLRDVAIESPGTYKVVAKTANGEKSVTWTVFGTPERRAKNVILFVADGMAVAHRTAARILSKGLKEGRYGGELAIDDMPHMALVSTSGSDAVVTDSANSMGSYTGGHKSCTNALGVYCARNKSQLAHPKVELITELARRRYNMSIGIVTNTEIQDATPAGMVAHNRRRNDYTNIVKDMLRLKPEVVLGGGIAGFLPKSEKGSKRNDDDNYIDKFKAAGYTYATNATQMRAAAGASHLLGLFTMGNMDGALDRHYLKKGTVERYPDQPDLTEQTKIALGILSKNPNGFVLLVESGMLDKFTHGLDWERAVYETILLDNAVKVAKEFAAGRDDTLIIVVPDHAHPISIVGTYNDERPGQLLRDKLEVYGASAPPPYPKADDKGYPPSVDIPRRLAFGFGAFPDHCSAGKPVLAGPTFPTTKQGDTYVANESLCQVGATRFTGTLPFNQAFGVHAADDVILTAMGPGAELFHGRIDNTRVFRVMATALGLAGKK